MKMSQINNLLSFTILLSRVSKDSYFMNSDISYIWEKYQKMIGLTPIKMDGEFSDWWQVVVLGDFKAMSKKALWIEKWGRRKLTRDQESVLNYLCVIDINSMSLENILEIFKNYIGQVEDISTEEYTHIHPLMKDFIEEYKEKFRREINIEVLI